MHDGMPYGRNQGQGHSREVDRQSPTGLIFSLCICVVFCPYVIYYPTVMARYSLFVLKVPLNPKQTNKQFSGTFGPMMPHPDTVTSQSAAQGLQHVVCTIVICCSTDGPRASDQ